MDNLRRFYDTNRVAICEAAGNVYVYVEYDSGETSCFTFTGDVNVIGQQMTLGVKLVCIENRVTFPGDE